MTVLYRDLQPGDIFFIHGTVIVMILSVENMKYVYMKATGQCVIESPAAYHPFDIVFYGAQRIRWVNNEIFV